MIPNRTLWGGGCCVLLLLAASTAAAQEVNFAAQPGVDVHAAVIAGSITAVPETSELFPYNNIRDGDDGTYVSLNPQTGNSAGKLDIALTELFGQGETPRPAAVSRLEVLHQLVGAGAATLRVQVLGEDNALVTVATVEASGSQVRTVVTGSWANLGAVRVSVAGTGGPVRVYEVAVVGPGAPPADSNEPPVAVDDEYSTAQGTTLDLGSGGAGQSGIIQIIAGVARPGQYSGLRALATSVTLGDPDDLAFDGNGNLYIALTGQGFVARITPDGFIERFAGMEGWGFSGDGGPATSARLFQPQGVATDSSGNVYIVDRFNQRVRRVRLDGIIETFAGNGVSGFSGDGGPAINASLRDPLDVAVDEIGNVYIADTGNRRVRRVGLDGKITTFAGNGQRSYSGDGGPANNASLDAAYLAVDALGQVYIADNGNDRVRRVGLDDRITTIAGTGVRGYSGDGGQATAAQLGEPGSIALDSFGNVYFVQNGSSRYVRRISPDGQIDRVAGNGSLVPFNDGVPATSVALDPRFVTVDGSGNFYVSDWAWPSIRKVTVVAPSGVAGSVLLNDADPNGDPLTASLATAPQRGELDFQPDGTFHYAPTSDFSGTDSFTYRANDGQLDSNTATVSIVVRRPPLTFSPTEGTAGRTEPVRVLGLGFQSASGLALRLERDTQTIQGQQLQVLTDSLLAASFSLAAEHVGDWDMVLTHGGNEERLSQAFHVVPERPDGRVILGPLQRAVRPGFMASYPLLVNNSGTASFDAGAAVSVTVPSGWTWLPASSSAGASLSNGQVTGPVGGLAPGGDAELLVAFQVPVIPQVQLGDVVELLAQISFNDDTPWNNRATIMQTIRGSWDPNDKLVAPQSHTDGDSDLLYHIDFENLGNAEAINIRIVDPLPASLDPATLADVSDNGTYNAGTGELVWTLNDINLPPQGKGYVDFRVRPVTGLPDGTVITNTAAIYFDFNPAVDTPPASVTVDRAPPSSAVTALSAETEGTDISVAWSGDDGPNDGSTAGIFAYTIFVARDAEGYAAWLTDTTALSGTYTGLIGHRYKFFSTATDNLGHVEDLPAAADAETLLVPVPLPQPVVSTVSPTKSLPAGGGTVIVSGQNFAPGAVVRIGGAESPRTVFLSDTLLKATVPPGDLALVDVGVVNADGGYGVLAGAFSYLPTIPALSEWGLIALCAVMGLVFARRLRQGCR